MIRKFARPYAKAALALVEDDRAAETLVADIGRFVETMQAVPRISSMASSPAIPMETKVETVRAVAGSLALGDLATRTIVLLTENYRLPYLADVERAIAEEVKRRLGIVGATVTSATPLDEQQSQQMLSLLERALGQKVELDLRVQPDLLGGFVAQVGSRRYDVSLKGQLERMADEMASAH